MVVRLDGLLDEDSSQAVVALLWDLVVGQGNLSVAVDARTLTLSDPVLTWIFEVIERESALRGGNLAVVEGAPLPAPTEYDLTAAGLDRRRARRTVAIGRAAHPAGSLGTTHIESDRSQT